MNGKPPRLKAYPQTLNSHRRDTGVSWVWEWALSAGSLLICWAGITAMAQTPATQPAAGELRPILSPEARREAATRLIERFIEHVQTSADVGDKARQALQEAWQAHRGDEQIEDFLEAGLAVISERYMLGMTAAGEGDLTGAHQHFSALMQDKDAYIALHAAAAAARVLVEQEDLEEAESILEPLAAREQELIDKSFLETEVDFLLGYCQLANLHYDKAAETLQRFEEQHPDAPERFRLPVRQMLQELQTRRPEGLGEVSDLMTYSGRRLANGKPGKPVLINQERAVELLSKLIKEAEEREQQGKGCKECQGKGCKKCQGGRPQSNQRSNSPANQSMLPGGSGRIGDLNRTPQARPGEMWGQMRPEERERVLQSLKKTFPSQYRQLVEQYYKQLAKEK